MPPRYTGTPPHARQGRKRASGAGLRGAGIFDSEDAWAIRALLLSRPRPSPPDLARPCPRCCVSCPRCCAPSRAKRGKIFLIFLSSDHRERCTRPAFSDQRERRATNGSDRLSERSERKIFFGFSGGWEPRPRALSRGGGRREQCFSCAFAGPESGIIRSQWAWGLCFGPFFCLFCLGALAVFLFQSPFFSRFRRFAVISRQKHPPLWRVSGCMADKRPESLYLGFVGSSDRGV